MPRGQSRNCIRSKIYGIFDRVIPFILVFKRQNRRLIHFEDRFRYQALFALFYRNFDSREEKKRMSAPIVGALLGVSVQIYANLVQKLPVMYTPWRHVMSGALGAGFASYVVQYEERTAKELDGTLLFFYFRMKIGL